MQIVEFGGQEAKGDGLGVPKKKIGIRRRGSSHQEREVAEIKGETLNNVTVV